MLDEPLMLQLNLPAADTKVTKSNKLVTSVKIRATGKSELNESPRQEV